MRNFAPRALGATLRVIDARWWVGLLFVAPLLLPWASGPGTDLKLYMEYGSALLQGRRLYAEVPIEYPPLSVPFFVLPALVRGGLRGFTVAFFFGMGLLDLAQRLAMMRLGGPHRHACLALSTLAGAALYYTYLKRFDVAAAAMCTLALCALLRRPDGAGAWGWLAAATACKLYPIVLAPLFIRYSVARGVAWRRLVVQVSIATALGLTILGVAYALGGDASLHWMRYHRDRGLHLASTYTAAALLYFGLGRPLQMVGAYGCIEVVGPWASRCAQLAPCLTLLALAATYAQVLPTLRQPRDLCRGALAAVVALLLTSKVFSPQYMIWLVPLGALAATQGRRVDMRLAAALLLACVFTAELHPREGALGSGHLLKQLCLIGRSVAMVYLWWRVCRPGREVALHRGARVRAQLLQLRDVELGNCGVSSPEPAEIRKMR